MKTFTGQWYFLMVLLFMNSCGPKFKQSPVVLKNPNISVPLAALLTFDTNQPVSTIVEFKSNDHAFVLEFDSEKNPLQGLPLVGMKPGREYSLTVSIKSGNKVKKFENELIWTTPVLPDDPYEFPKITVKKNKKNNLEPGIVFFNPRRTVRQPGMNESFGMLAAVDSSGDVVWFYRTGSRISDFDINNNGRITYITQDFQYFEIDLLGNVTRSWYAARRPQGIPDSGIPVDALTFHHDAYPLKNGNFLILSTELKQIDNYYSSEFDENAPRKTMDVMGDVLLEFNPDGKIVWEWHAFDHLDPFRIGHETFTQYWQTRGFNDYNVADWSHANTILEDPSGESILFNSRTQSAVFKINKKTKEIEWIFGEPSGWSEKYREKLITLEGENQDWFWHQHSPSFSDDGILYVFNNDNYRTRPFGPVLPARVSFAAAYKINNNQLTARQVWNSKIDGELGIESRAMGDVDWLPNTGNVLVSYGFLVASEEFGYNQNWTMVREFSPSTPTSILWEMHLSSLPVESGPPVGWSVFSAEKVSFFNFKTKFK